MTGLYIHIPFCKTICNYCDFPKHLSHVSNHNLYINAIIKELQIFKKLGQLQNIKTIYIGGGTPTVLSDENTTELFGALHELIDIDKIEEFTIEANPESLNLSKIKIYKKYGINRVSLGVQTFNEQHLKLLGRNHNAKQVFETITNLINYSITNINVDLIYGFFNQTINDVYYDIEKLSELNIKHISYYSLILEPNTVFNNLVNQGKRSELEEDIVANMFDKIKEKLTAQNFLHYETSNFSKKGYQSMHNKIYWKNQQYVGIGVGAHGFIDNYRYSNPKVYKKYLEQIKNIDLSKIETNIQDYFEDQNNHLMFATKMSDVENIENEFMLGLRLTEGIEIDTLYNKYQKDLVDKYILKLQKHKQNNLIRIDDKIIKLTDKGQILANEVLVDIIGIENE